MRLVLILHLCYAMWETLTKSQSPFLFVCLFSFGLLGQLSLKYLWALYSVMIIYEATVRTVLSSVLLVFTV